PRLDRARRRERRGIDRAVARPDDLAGAVGLDARDPRRPPRVAVRRVDADLALGGVEPLAAHRLDDGARLGRARRGDGLGPEVDAEVARLERVGRLALRAEALLDAAHELAVRGRVDRREVAPRGVVAGDVARDEALLLARERELGR